MFLSVSVYASDFMITNAWARATPPGQEVASVDLTITGLQAATLVAVSSTISKSVELHHMAEIDGMMSMREVQGIDLPAGKRFMLGKRGYHLMLQGLTSPLKAGETLPLKLTFKLADNRMEVVEVDVAVKSLTTTSDSMD